MTKTIRNSQFAIRNFFGALRQKNADCQLINSVPKPVNLFMEKKECNQYSSSRIDAWSLIANCELLVDFLHTHKVKIYDLIHTYPQEFPY